VKTFKRNDLIVAIRNWGIRSSGDCIIAGEQYVVVKTDENGFGLFLDHCSYRDDCSCLNSWWAADLFDHYEDPHVFTKSEVDEMVKSLAPKTLPSAEDVAHYFGVKA
jgi:hypothetical protein